MWWLETPKLEALATAEQDARFEVDVWQEPIERWLGLRKKTGVAEILERIFGIAPENQSRAAQMRVSKILHRLVSPGLGRRRGTIAPTTIGEHSLGKVLGKRLGQSGHQQGRETVRSVIHMSSGGVPIAPPVRLIYAVDATASREHAWTIARDVQSRMFIEAANKNMNLNLLLVYYGGKTCRVSKWKSRGEDLARLMNTVECEAGATQIERVLRHALREHEKAPIQAVTFIGDAMEEELDVLAGLADKLGAARVPLHTFLEGNDTIARNAFRLLALRSGGTFSQFNAAQPEAIQRLSAQLTNIALTAASTLAIGTNKWNK